MARGGPRRRARSSRSAMRGQRAQRPPVEARRGPRPPSRISRLVEDEGDVGLVRSEGRDPAVGAARHVHLAVIAQALDPGPVPAHGELPERPVLAQQAELPRHDAAPAVGPDDQARVAAARGPRARRTLRRPRRGPRRPAPRDRRAPSRPPAPRRPAARAESSSARSRHQRRTANPGSRAPAYSPWKAVPSGAVKLHAAQRRAGAGRARPPSAPMRAEQPPGFRGHALAADLVAREARLVEEDDLVAGLAQEDGGGRARRPATHHHHLRQVTSPRRPARR